MTTNTGKLFVIEGIDGSGKSTQHQLLVEKLKEEGYKVRTVDFPQYGKKSCGSVEKYLNGDYGDSHKVTPEQASLLFLVDQFDARDQIKTWLHEGCVVIANRYGTSNIGHQGGKIKDSTERKEFMYWLFKVEYEIMGMPRPDLVFYLQNDIGNILGQLQHRNTVKMVSNTDIHEKSINHLRNAQIAYEQATSMFSNWVSIQCKNKTQENIHDEIYQSIISYDEYSEEDEE